MSQAANRHFTMANEYIRQGHPSAIVQPEIPDGA